MEILDHIIATAFSMLSMLMSIVIDEDNYRTIMHFLHLDKVAEWVIRHHL